jgi:superfamily II DNA or RNA helicase
VIAQGDESALERLVGTTTFERGRSYAEHGAVRNCTWNPGGTHVVGQVQGGAARPYVASVRLTRSPNRQLSAIEATCSCPVGYNCKHAVALVLADDEPGEDAPRTPTLTLVRGDSPPDLRPTVKGKGRTRPPAGRSRAADAVDTDTDPADWALPLEALLDGDGGPDDPVDDTDPAELALQFELIVTPQASGRRSSSVGPGIRVRPVVPGRSGNWVRTGVSWSSLEYFSYGRRRSARFGEQLLVVKELLALSRLSGGQNTYSYTDEVVRLEAINSRRLWDLLGEARGLGIPLIQAGRPAQPLAFLPTVAAVTIDVTRTGSGLRAQPRIGTDAVDLPLETSMLIGRPAHGIAWWDGTGPTSAPGAPATGLGLAALDTPVDDDLRAFLRTATVDVPRHDEERFVRALVPRLRRRVRVASSDRSVVLPEARPATLLVTLRHDEGHRLHLDWAIGGEGIDGRERLWGARGRFRDRAAEEVLMDAVVDILRPMPELFERWRAGDRLAPESHLEGMDVVRFITELLPRLEATDGVVVEHVGTLPEYHEADAAPVVSLGGQATKDNDWFDLTVTVTVGGEKVPFAELFVALAEGQGHLILPSGTWFSLDSEELGELARLIAEARALLDASDDGIRLSRFQASLWEDIQHLGVVTAQARAWEESVRSLTEAADRAEYPSPTGLKATLRPYQLAGFNWLAYLYEHRLGGVLADDMGLGKTLEALALMCHTNGRGLSDDPWLVVAPTSVVGNWAAECKRFAPGLGVVTVTETEKRRGTSLAEHAGGADLVVTSYSLFRLEYDGYAALSWAGLFLDEAQFAKNRQSQTYQRAKLLPAPFKVCMTGTPIENNLMELWSLLSIAAPGLFTSPERFSEYYRLPIERNADTERLAQLRRRVRPLMLRRTKEQVASDLPDKQEQVLELDLNPRHHRIYQTHLQRERQKILGLLGDMNKNRMAIFRSLTLLRQASLDVSLIDDSYDGVPSTKLDALMEMLEDIVEDGHRVLVFSQFTRFLTLARRRIEKAGIDLCYLDGKTRRRDAVIAEFRDGAAPVFLISLKAGGFGLNLTEADYCVLLDPWWNPATEAQAVDRVHRIGQTRKVMVYRLVAKDTIEEKVMALKAKKSALFADVMDAGGLESGALTAADIRGLLD